MCVLTKNDIANVLAVTLRPISSSHKFKPQIKIITGADLGIYFGRRFFFFISIFF